MEEDQELMKEENKKFVSHNKNINSMDDFYKLKDSPNRNGSRNKHYKSSQQFSMNSGLGKTATTFTRTVTYQS